MADYKRVLQRLLKPISESHISRFTSQFHQLRQFTDIRIKVEILEWLLLPGFEEKF